jgi:hypothetical protein
MSFSRGTAELFDLTALYRRGQPWVAVGIDTAQRLMSVRNSRHWSTSLAGGTRAKKPASGLAVRGGQ